MEVDGLGVIEVRVNGYIIRVEEKLARLLKLDTEVRVDHGYNSNKKNVLIQEGGACAAIFDNLSNINI